MRLPIFGTALFLTTTVAGLAAAQVDAPAAAPPDAATDTTTATPPSGPAAAQESPVSPSAERNSTPAAQASAAGATQPAAATTPPAVHAVAAIGATQPAAAMSPPAVDSAAAAPMGIAPAVPGAAAPLEPAAPAKKYPSFKFYGHARLDMAYSTQRMKDNELGLWALSPSGTGADEAEFVIYPRWTRLGVVADVAEPAEGVSITAKVEIDFVGGGSESRELPRLRHAYGQLAMGDFEILGGQTWDLFAPLIYGGMEQAIFWYGGNLGDRRPQLRITYGPRFGNSQVVLAVAAGQSGAVDMADVDGDDVNDGVSSARPALQGLAELRAKLTPDAKKPLRVGISGHYGGKRIRVAEDDEMFDVVAGVAHLEVPISILTLSVEGYLGENLRDVRGGVGQGIALRRDPATSAIIDAESIPAKGGFIQLAVDPVDWYGLQLGLGVDNPKGVEPGGRGMNQTFHFANAFKPYKQFVVGAVYDYYRTSYVGDSNEDGEAHRFDLYTMVPF